MKKIVIPVLFCFFLIYTNAQNVTAYNKQEVMIPMRDGIRLYTVIFTPKDVQGSFPILIQRTPYGAAVAGNYNILNNVYFANMAREGYIIVLQDIRGKYK